MDIYYSSVGRNGVLLLNIPPDKEGLINQKDVEALEGWTKIRQATFGVNLAKGAVITSSNGKNIKALLDDNYSTSWTTKGKDSTALIELNLKELKTFDVLLLQENITVGQRIEKFVLEYWSGKTWEQAAQGTTVGYKRLITFKPISTTKVRLKIEQSRLNPTISEFGLFRSPLK
ncbi:discoidin domain-containing protein [Pedobacter arcticus]|uniref:discoidin domain-containing protein n=1 Tax=Pedobacter arcticus TaxID=752140 RepID=UPI00037285D5|nr:discoidin domain-containing protein [Pedobacter arcticus]